MKPKLSLIIMIFIAVLTVNLFPTVQTFASDSEIAISSEAIDESGGALPPLEQDELIPEADDQEIVSEGPAVETVPSENEETPSLQDDKDAKATIFAEADTDDADGMTEGTVIQAEDPALEEPAETANEDPAFVSPAAALSGDPSKESRNIPETVNLTKAVNTRSGIRICWESPSSADGYLIYKKIGADYMEIQGIASGSTQEWIDKGALTGGAEYRYKVKSYKNVSGIRYCSDFSNEGSCVRLGAPTVTVKNYGEDDRRLLVTWSKVAGADGYLVYRSRKKSSGFSLVTREEIRRSFVDDELKPKTTYYYKVKAYRYKEPGNGRYRLDDSYHSGAMSSVQNIRTKKTVVDGRDFDKASYRFIDYTSYRKKDVTVSKATDSAAKSIYRLLKKGKNFTVYVKKKDSKSAEKIMDSLVKKVRKLSDVRIGFRYVNCYGAGKLKYQLFEVDALEYKYVRKYIKMAYRERMAAYKEYISCGRSPEYYYRKGKYGYSTFVSKPFECAYGTSLKDLSTESLLLFVTPSTRHVVGCNYMTYNSRNHYDNIIGIEGFIRLYNKSANGVCANFADVTVRLCNYLGIKCWYISDLDVLFHAWAIAKVKTETGKTVYYWIDNGIPYQVTSKYQLGPWMKKVTKKTMGKDYNSNMFI